MIFLVDVDHTLSDARWRDSMIDTASWDDYHRASEHDTAVTATCILIDALVEAGHTGMAITVRPAKYREMTSTWLVRNGCQLEEILMRDDEDFRPAPEIKLDLARRRFGHDLKSRIGLLIEDRSDVVSAFLAEGVTCIHVRTA